jgi:hypothetical protein
MAAAARLQPLLERAVEIAVGVAVAVGVGDATGGGAAARAAAGLVLRGGGVSPEVAAKVAAVAGSAGRAAHLSLTH